MCGNHRAMKEILSVLLRYADRDPEDPIPDHEDGHKIAEFLCRPEGRERYIAWQKEHHAMWKVLRTSSRKLTALACGTCKGRGKIPLLVSEAPCSECQPDPKVEIKDPFSDEAMKRSAVVDAKQRIIQTYLSTPEGRRKLAESCLTVKRHGKLDTPLEKFKG